MHTYAHGIDPHRVARPPREVKHYHRIDEVSEIPPEDREKLRAVSEEFTFRANDYYLGLINWDDPDDPIRRLIIPQTSEMNDWGRFDPSNEASVTVARGVQHKYPHTVLLLCHETCGAYCRYCFRKRLFIRKNEETSNDISEGLDYIREHPEVNNVLLTGGDPLQMPTSRLGDIIASLRQIPHVRIIRIGSKLPAFNPFRILDDRELLSIFRTFSTPRNRIYLMCHFDHPNELTDEAVAGIDAMITSGVICVNQCPLIHGINDDPGTLATLFSELSYVGCPPYYLFQCRPTRGNKPFAVPMVRGWETFRRALRIGSGLARRARFVMSHEQGKAEVAGIDEEHIYIRFHRGKNPEIRGRFLTYKRNDNAYWLDDLEPADGADLSKYPPRE